MKQDASVYSAFNVGTIVPQYSVSQAQNDLADGKIVVLAGGTGNPYVTTDTCAAIRAAELGADAIFKATKVDGVYAEDPMKNPKAKRFETMTFDECINRRIGVIDLTAVQICQQANVPIVIFHFDNLDRLKELVAGKKPYSIISR
jgi:uridylate kinase